MCNDRCGIRGGVSPHLCVRRFVFLKMFETLDEFCGSDVDGVDEVESGGVGGESDDCSDVIDDREEKKNGYFFHGQFLYVTFAKCKETDVVSLEKRLREAVPEISQVFGSMELHADGTPHYHFVCGFVRRVRWTNTRAHFLKMEETRSMHFDKPGNGQSVVDFLDGTQAYCAKDGNENTFGKWVEVGMNEGSRGKKRRRVYDEIHAMTDRAEAKRRLMEVDPVHFVYSYPAVVRYLDNEKVSKGEPGGGRLVEDWYREFLVPVEMENWVKEYVFNEDRKGRARPLVLVGEAVTGKTSWARSFGNPLVMSRRWNLKAYGEGFTHIVVNDVDVLKFGASGESYWREVLGCQMEFDATDRYCPTVRLKWDLPCVWTCHWDMDPRRNDNVRRYLDSIGAYVVEVNEKLFK